MRKSLFVLLGAALLVLAVPSATAAPAPQKLPNLHALSATNIQIAGSGNRQEIRFSTTSENLGAGPLELRAGEISKPQKKQKVYQRIYLEAGGYQDVLAGEFVYHPGHRHFHFEGYANYQLIPDGAPTTTRRSSNKTSFCIMDTTHTQPQMTGSPPSAQYSTCGDQVQGMSVGWGDRYGFHLAGQSIDISRLPDGDYRLQITIDPNHHLSEITTTDNVSSVRVRLTGGALSCPDFSGGVCP